MGLGALVRYLGSESVGEEQQQWAKS
jgi:hypothetical protein